MTRALWRLLLICCAWSLGAALVWATGARGLGTLVPALFAVAAYLLTRELTPRGRSGPPKYWRGRRLD